ncbi:UNVERIFIED_CONTAM: hypothetical protein FKN15_049150 [Acipenser sinensis]
MDPLGNSLSDMPAYENTEDEQFPPLSPPLSPRDGDPFATAIDLFLDDNPGEVSKLDEAPVAKRRSVKRPQPKLDSQRLISERGLPALRTMFNNVRFKGKGHETCLKRIRLDMPLTHEDFMTKDGVSAQPPVTQSTPAKPTDPDELDSELELESLDLDTVVVKHTNSTCEQGWELKERAVPVCADSLKEGDAPVCADSLKEGDAPVCADSLKEGDAPVCADSLKESASTEQVSASGPEDQQKVNSIEQDTD